MLHENDNASPRNLGRYRLVAFLDQREFGTTHLAVTHGARPKLVVLKELRQDLTRKAKFVETFLTEARLAAALKHANVIQTFEAGREGDRLFLSMEFLDGQPLSKILLRDERGPKLSLSARIQILCGALSGLEHAHGLSDYDGVALGLVHRDISPQNLFVTYDGQVKVIDFGIAKAAEAGDSPSPGGFKGKLAYASPEQVQGQPVDRRTDVFAIGVMLWEAIAMRRFAPGAPTRAAIEKRILGREPRIAEVVPDVEPLLAEICDRAIHVDPASRYPSAKALRQALLTFLFVGGESANPSEIGQVVRAKFVEERAEMHQVIGANVKEGELPESMRAPAYLSDADEIDDGPTKIADLSRYVEGVGLVEHAPATKAVPRKPVPREPVPREPVTTEPVTSEPPTSHLGGYVPPPTTWSRAPTRAAGSECGPRPAPWRWPRSLISRCMHVRIRPAPLLPWQAFLVQRRRSAPAPGPVPAPAPAQGVDAPSIPEAEPPAPPVLEISNLAREAPTRLAPAGKARLHRATVARARAVAPLRERQPERASLRLAPLAPPVEPRNDPAPAAAIPEKSVSHDDMGQDLNSLPQSHHPRSIDQDNPFR